ncbi:MAG: hypothetical protein KDA21_07320 [Phycisphaerales bacterium]|nr:hypothetical protein [Phycisphaerales bacterium]
MTRSSDRRRDPGGRSRAELRFICRCEPITWVAPRGVRRHRGWLRDISRRGIGLLVRGDSEVHRVGKSLLIFDPDSHQPHAYRIVRREHVDATLYRLGCELQTPEDTGRACPVEPVPTPTLSVRLRPRQRA